MLSYFDEYFFPQQNHILERGIFWDRNQLLHENNTVYITIMYNLISTCDYAGKKDEMLRDKLCHGIKDRELAAELRDDKNLNLDIVLRKLKAKDRIVAELDDEKQRQDKSLKGVKSESLDALKWQGKKKSYNKPGSSQGSSSYGGSSSQGKKKAYETRGYAGKKGCTRCGNREPHKCKDCPAINAECFKCKGRGHFANCCFKAKKEGMREVVQDEEEEEVLSDSSFKLEELVLASAKAKHATPPWRVILQVGSVYNNVTFKIDSGADVCAITQQDAERLQPQPKFVRPTGRLVGPDNGVMSTTRLFRAPIRCGKEEVQTNIYVIPKLRENLLSREVSSKLNILSLNTDIMNLQIATVGKDDMCL
jgi:hypothetical protein